MAGLLIRTAFLAIAAVSFAGAFGNRLGGAATTPSIRASAAASGSRQEPRPVGDRVLAVNADLRGHFIVHPQVAGHRMRMLVDTGATSVALTHEDAAQAGIKPGTGRPRRVSTANGVIEVQATRIAEMRLGDIVVRDVEAVVMPPGRFDTSLLGMSFLRGLRSFEIGQGRLVFKG